MTVEAFKGPIAIIQVLVVKSIRDITPGEYLSLDYGWSSSDVNDLQLACLCRSNNCTGRLFKQSFKATTPKAHGTDSMRLEI